MVFVVPGAQEKSVGVNFHIQARLLTGSTGTGIAAGLQGHSHVDHYVLSLCQFRQAILESD